MKTLVVDAVAALAIALLVVDCAAAEPPSGARATPGSVVPSSGTTAPPSVAAPARTASAVSRTGRTAGSLSGPPPADCAALRRRYAESQACFSPYRLANGGIKPEAFKRCRDVADPALTCGPETASP